MFRVWLAVTLIWCGLIGCISGAGFRPQIIDYTKFTDEQLRGLLAAAHDRQTAVVIDVARPYSHWPLRVLPFAQIERDAISPT
jgi:hypothetical protein